MRDALSRYRQQGRNGVEGWLSETAMDVIVALARVQRGLEVVGPVCEVGVHHGKLFILLHLLTEQSEWSAAWDLFERQEENREGSGAGDRNVFEENLRRCGCDLDRVTIRTGNSLRLSPKEVLEDCHGRPRLFSIDGGHEAEVALNDLRLAGQTLCDRGLVILDDVFNEEWPGVSEGLFGFLTARPGGELLPFLVAGNKVLLTNSEEARGRYSEEIRRLWKPSRLKQVAWFGRDVLIVLPEKRSRLRILLASTPVWRAIRRRRVASCIRRFFDRRASN